MIKKAKFCDICGERFSTFDKHSLISKIMGDGCPMEMRYKAGALVDICQVCRNTLQETLNRLGSTKR